MKSNKLKSMALSLALVLTMLIGMVPGMSLTAYAASASYVDGSGESKTVDATELEAATTNWTDGSWYIVPVGGLTISGRIAVDGTVNLILRDGATLTASAGIRTTGATLNIYAQSAGTGALTATGNTGGAQTGGSAGIGGNGVGMYADGGAGGTVNIYGGTVTATGGNGGDYAGGGAGIGGGGLGWRSNAGSGVGGTVNIYGGTVTATGGNKSTKSMGDNADGPGIGGGGNGRDTSTPANGTLTLGKGVKLYNGTDNTGTVLDDSDSESRIYSGSRVKTMFAELLTHEHNFNYSADGATITATCSAADCTLPEVEGKHIATLTIAAPLHTTYGDGKDATAVITDGNSIQGEAKVQYQKKTGGSYGTATETAPTDAGDYKASITLGEATASVEYTIAKADPTANAPTGLTATYGQTLSDVTLTNPTGNTPGSWSWADSSTSVGSVGEHTFKANFTPEDTANYNSKENVDVAVTVGKAANPATVDSTASVKKGGNELDLHGNVKLNGATGKVSYAISGETLGCTLSGSKLTSGNTEGSVTVNVAVAADDNYNASASMPITVTITKKDTQTITAEDVTATYGDTGVKVAATTTGDGQISYAVKDGSGECIGIMKDTGVLTLIKAGTGTVVVTASETSTYAQATKEVTVTINKAASNPAKVTANNRTYDGKKKDLLTVEGEASGGTMMYALGSETAPGAEYSEDIPAAADIGTYYVWYKVVGDENHEDTEPAYVTAKIEARQFTITYDLNGGKLDGETGKVTRTAKEDEVITLPAPTRDGYTFDYWEGSKYNAGDKYTVNGDHTFKAVWKTADKGGSKGGSSSGKNGVKTGDTNDIAGLLALMLASGGALGAMGYRRRKEH